MFDYEKAIPFERIPKAEATDKTTAGKDESQSTENVPFDYTQHIPLDGVTRT